MKRYGRDFKPQKWENCPTETLMTAQLRMPSSNINIITFSGYVNLTKDIQGDMELVIEANRCTLDLKTCEKYPGARIKELCKRFSEKNKFYSSVFENIKPPAKCPVKAGNYTLKETKLDLSALAVIPLDGYLWVVAFKILSTDPGTKKKRLVMCLNSETKISRSNIKTFSRMISIE